MIRFDFDPYNAEQGMTESADGDYVLYADHIAALSVERLKSRLMAHEDRLRTYRKNETNEALARVLRQIVSSLPQKRDWLDPAVEREARAVLDEMKGEAMTKQEYERKFKANEQMTGLGLDTTMHMPCPFCAEPDFMIYRILDSETRLAGGAVCQHCKRGMKALFSHDGGGLSFEMVQTCGDDPPDFLPPLRRVE